MFFLGPSAHLIFYGLLSAILMICCQSTGREFIKDSLGETMRVAEFPSVASFSAENEHEICFYANEIANNSHAPLLEKEECLCGFVTQKATSNYPYISSRYIAEVIHLYPFRAPPRLA
ncbi:MAG: hypothetical protein ACRDDZ_10355 [Marinifilaceae bacterium]